jgi:hypothetical protein
MDLKEKLVEIQKNIELFSFYFRCQKYKILYDFYRFNIKKVINF